MDSRETPETPKSHIPGTPYSPGELILKWGYSRPSVIRIIKNEPDVLKLRQGPKGTRTCYSVPEDVEQRIRRKLANPPPRKKKD
jgi:hypothetical protein